MENQEESKRKVKMGVDGDGKHRSSKKKDLWVEHFHRQNNNAGFFHSRNKIYLLLIRKGTFDFLWKVLELLPDNFFWFKVSL